MLKKLGKLLKYEFRFYFRILPPLYLALILAALIVRFKGNVPGIGIPLLIFAWSAMISAIAVITIVHIIQRFTDNFMKDQGSLMFTLPVTIWSLVASKAIAAFCMVLISSITVFVSILILARRTGERMFSFLTQTINLPVPNLGEIMLLAFVVCAMIFLVICRIYLAIITSHILPRFRFAAGCGIYLALSFLLEQPVFNLANKNTALDLEFYSNSTFWLPFNDDYFFVSHIPIGLVALAFTALYFWATGFLLKRSFNLE